MRHCEPCKPFSTFKIYNIKSSEFSSLEKIAITYWRLTKNQSDAKNLISGLFIPIKKFHPLVLFCGGSFWWLVWILGRFRGLRGRFRVRRGRFRGLSWLNSTSWHMLLIRTESELVFVGSIHITWGREIQKRLEWHLEWEKTLSSPLKIQLLGRNQSCGGSSIPWNSLDWADVL